MCMFVKGHLCLRKDVMVVNLKILITGSIGIDQPTYMKKRK